jgi:hypothetical protein
MVKDINVDTSKQAVTTVTAILAYKGEEGGSSSSSSFLISS